MRTNIKFSMFSLLIFFITASGCARSMILTNRSSHINIKKEGIAIMSWKTSNKMAPYFTPKLNKIQIVGLEHKYDETFDVLYHDPHEIKQVFSSEKPKLLKEEYWEYLLSFQLPTGRYKINEVKGEAGNILLYGLFKLKLLAEFEVKPEQVLYIGHVDMTNRKRKDGEPRSGKIIPLLGQQASGFYSGTMGIKISDRYEKDLKLFRDTYPALEKIEIIKDISVLNRMENIPAGYE